MYIGETLEVKLHQVHLTSGLFREIAKVEQISRRPQKQIFCQVAWQTPKKNSEILVGNQWILVGPCP